MERHVCNKTAGGGHKYKVCNKHVHLTEVESPRTHFDVLGLESQVLGLEALSPRKLPCLRLEDSTIFWIVKILQIAWKDFWKTFYFGEHLKKFF